MRTLSLRALHREPPTDHSVLVTHGGQVIGTFVPVAAELDDAATGVAGAPLARGQQQRAEMSAQPPEEHIFREPAVGPNRQGAGSHPKAARSTPTAARTDGALRAAADPGRAERQATVDRVLRKVNRAGKA